MQKQTWGTKAGFLASCGVSKQNAFFLSSRGRTFSLSSPHELRNNAPFTTDSSSSQPAKILWIVTGLASWVSQNQSSKRCWGFWIGLGLALELLLRQGSSPSYFNFFWRNRAASSYMLGVCLKTTFWRLNSIRNSFHKKFICIRKTCIQTHKTQCWRRCSICNPGRPCCHQGRLSLWPHREQWPKDWHTLPSSRMPGTDKRPQRTAWRAPSQLHHCQKVFPGVYS